MIRLANIRLFRLSMARKSAAQFNSDKFIYDTNQHLKREHLYEMKTKANEEIVFQRANMKDDYPLILDFMVTFFGVNEPLNAAAGFTSEDASEIINIIMKETTYAVLAKHGDKFVGMGTVGVAQVPKHQGEEPKRLTDYGHEIDNGPLKSRRANQVFTFVHANELLIPWKISTPCTTATGQLTNVHPKYYNKGIAKALEIFIHQIAIKEGADFFIGPCSAVATAQMFGSFPEQILIDSYPYGDFYDHGTQPFKNLSDGGTVSAVYALDLKKHGHLYTIENIMRRK